MAALNGTALAWRFARRELRGGLAGFYIFIACIAIGVAAISGVGSVATAMKDSLTREGRAILGGDVDFTLTQRSATPVERDYLEGLGPVSEAVSMRAMARALDGESQALVELKGVDGLYPLSGRFVLRGGADLQSVLAEEDGVFGAVVDDVLFARIDADVGDRISIGEATIEIRGVIESEPDKLATGVGFGPRAMLSLEGMETTGLIQPGSLLRFHYRIAAEPPMSDGQIAALKERSAEEFPNAGWRIRDRNNASPGLAQQIDRFSQFLTLVGLTALVVGGVGVANAVRAFLETKQPVIATFKCLGGTGAFVFRIYLFQIMVIAGIGIVAGLILGAVLPVVANFFLASILPSSQAGFYPGALALGAVYGMLCALAFALWPLGRAHDVPVSALFRDRVSDKTRVPRAPYLILLAICFGLLIALSVGLAEDRRIAALYVGASVAAFIVLLGASSVIKRIARSVKGVRRTELRLAIANIHRPGALTTSVVLSLGLGLALLVALTLIDLSLRYQLTANLPERAPSFFFVDIQNRIAPDFDALIDAEVPGSDLERVPMLRGRIVSLGGVPVSEIDPPAEEAWILRGDRGITYSAALPNNSSLATGEWWPENYDGKPLISFDDEAATAFGLEIGDAVVVNVLGREISAEIANTRNIVWESVGINFVMVFSPNTFRGAPHAHLATVSLPEGGTIEQEKALLKAVTNAFPAVTSVRVKDALETVNNVVSQLAWAVRAAASITLITSVLVLGGALAAGHRNRIYDAVVLKTLGATRNRLLAAFSIEYALLGLGAAVFGLGAGSLAAWAIVSQVMDFEFVLQPVVAVSATFGALVLTIGFGLIGTWRVLGQRPATHLRNL